MGSIIIDRPLMQNQGNVVSDMDGDIVMLNIQHGKYYNLGAIGGRIWGLLGSPTSSHQIIEVLLNEYQVDKTACQQQVVDFLEQLSAEGLIHAVDGGIDEYRQ
jgi:hypothetical protein